MACVRSRCHSVTFCVFDQHFTARRPDLLVRAARHYEGAAQVLLRRAVMSSQTFVTTGQGELPPIGQWHEVECPARIDLAGNEGL